MLLVVPTVRRRSVRSVATAAKPKLESLPNSDAVQADRAAALARSKWAPKLKPLTSPAGPSSHASSPGNPQVTRSIAWSSPSPSTPHTNPGSRLSPGSKWVQSAPVAAAAGSLERWRVLPSGTVSTPRTNPEHKLSLDSKWAQSPPAAVAASSLESSPATSSRKHVRASGKIMTYKSPERTWPSLKSAAMESDARTRWAPRSEPTPTFRPTSGPAELHDSTGHWATPTSPHSRWQPLEAPSQTSPSTGFHTEKSPPKFPTNRSNGPPDPRLQRGLAPHLDPHTTQESTRASFVPQPRHSRPLRSARGMAFPETRRPHPILIAKTEVVEQNSPKKTFKERHSLVKTDAPHTPVSQPKVHAPKAKKPWAYVEKRITEDVYIPSAVSVGHLARLLNVRLEDLQDTMHQAGMDAQASFDHVLTSDYAILLAEEFGRKPIVNDEAAFDLYPPPPHSNPDSLPNRPPVVTIMGHVDHGKTTLLDTLRSSSVAQGEVGGITQHIGAFSVPVPSTPGVAGPQSITFLDTPGHAAFSAMRARGARVTDIIVLVVAADDGLMPQTREVIELIKKDREKIGVVVAINKIDKPDCSIDAVQKALLVEDIHLEELGGDVPSVQVSGLTGQGLPELVDTISLMSDIQDLRAEPDGNVFGYVLESKVVKGLGPIATVLVLRGCLKPGSHVLSGVHHAKVRIMHDSNGKQVKAAPPGIAVTVSGWKSLPDAGDEVLQGTESEIKKAIINRQRKADIEASLVDIEAINNSRQQERERRQAEAEAETAGERVVKEEPPTEPRELRLLIKADVSGSAEAVEGALQGIGNHLATTKIISSSVGDIMESDVMRAKVVGGMIVGFSVSASRAVETLAAQDSVPIIKNDIIYRLMEEVKARVIGLLPVTVESRVTGEAKVLQLFDISVKGKQSKTVAGSRVINGIIEKNKPARVTRSGTVVYEGTFETMRHFKKDVTELRKGTECGLNLTDFDDLQADDIIQAYETIEKPGVL